MHEWSREDFRSALPLLLVGEAPGVPEWVPPHFAGVGFDQPEGNGSPIGRGCPVVTPWLQIPRRDGGNTVPLAMASAVRAANA